MKVNTLFPSSKNENGESKGGIILLKVAPAIIDFKDPHPEGTRIIVSYKDRNGVEHKNEQEVSFKNTTEEYYDNTGICVVCLVLELVGPWVELGFGVGMKAFDELLSVMFLGVRSSLMFSGFGLKPPASGFQFYFYSSLKTSPSIQHQ